jgi:uncharacterized protein YndB with AHSA1/START domain
MKFISERQRRARKRRRILGAVASLGTAFLALVGGVLLPIEHITTQSADFDRPPETVWRVLTDLDGMPLWRSDLITLERLPAVEGRTVWRENGRSGSRVIEFSWAEPPHRLVMQGTRSGRPGYPMRTFDLASIDRGTRVTITERSEVPNPLRRVLVRLDPGRSAVARFLEDLDLRLNLNRRQVAADELP